MKDSEKTKEQLVHELSELRWQNAALAKLNVEHIASQITSEKIHLNIEGMLNSIRQPLLVLDADLKVTSANEYFYHTFKVTPDETLGNFIYNLGNRQWDIPKLRELLEKVLPTKGVVTNFEVSHDFQNIGFKTMLVNACQIYQQGIATQLIFVSGEDITSRKKLENTIAASGKLFKRIYETANDGILLLEKDTGRITLSNLAAEKMLGYSTQESIGNKLEDVGITLDMLDFQTLLNTLNISGILNYRDLTVTTRSGQCINADIYIIGRSSVVQCNIRNTTERKLAEGQAKERMKELMAFYHLAEITRREGITPEEMYQEFTNILPQSWQYSEIAYARIVIGDSEFRTRNFTESKWMQSAPIKMSGSVVGKIEVGYLEEMPFLEEERKLIDEIAERLGHITERKQALKALLESEERYRAVTQSANDAIMTISGDGMIMGWNLSAERMFGYPEAEILGQPLDLIMPRQFRDGHREGLKRVQTGGENHMIGKTVELTGLHKNGSEFPLELSLSHWESPDGHFYTGIMRDITQRKQAEEQLQNTIESLRKSMSTTIQVMVSTVEARDPYTAGHQRRSADLARAIATEMKLSQEKVEGIRMAGSIHDIGKISIPAEILSKPTKLMEIEFSLITAHAQKGYEMLKDVESPWPLAEIVYQHHERIDGSGYPRNLKGEEILIEARILAVADTVEAMASHRPYRASLGIDAALNEIEKSRGIFYDNDVVDACLRLFREKGFQLVTA